MRKGGKSHGNCLHIIFLPEIRIPSEIKVNNNSIKNKSK